MNVGLDLGASRKRAWGFPGMAKEIARGSPRGTQVCDEDEDPDRFPREVSRAKVCQDIARVQFQVDGLQPAHAPVSGR